MSNQLTQNQVQALARKVGFGRFRDSRTLSAIAMVESPLKIGGISYSDFDAVGDQELEDETWGFSYGGCMIRALKAEYGKGTFRDAKRLVEPEFNVRSALKVKRTLGWNAWSVYSTGQHKAYLQERYPPAPGTVVVLGGDTLGSIAAELGDGTSWEDLARINGIHSPYTIYIGQTLRLN